MILIKVKVFFRTHKFYPVDFQKEYKFSDSTRYREEKRIEPSDGLQPFARGRLQVIFSQFGRISRAGRSLRSARMFAKTAGLRARRLRPPMAYTIE